MRKMRCFRCRYLNYDFFDDCYENTLHYFCGLHGRHSVDPNGHQINLNQHGSCGFQPKIVYVQLELFDYEKD